MALPVGLSPRGRPSLLLGIKILVPIEEVDQIRPEAQNHENGLTSPTQDVGELPPEGHSGVPFIPVSTGNPSEGDKEWPRDVAQLSFTADMIISIIGVIFTVHDWYDCMNHISLRPGARKTLRNC